MADDRVLVEFKGSSIKFSGILFEGETAKELKNTVGRQVQSLAKDGLKMVRAGIKTEHGTGFTRENLVVESKAANALYASVRLKDEKKLPLRVYPSFTSEGRPNKRAGQPIRDTDAYKARRVPFIVMAILESGRYGGSRAPSAVRVSGLRAVINRGRWQSGGRRQAPQYFIRRTSAALRAKTPAIREAIVARFNT